MAEDVFGQLLLAACVSVGVSVPMSITAFLLRGIFKRNTEAVESLQEVIQNIQISYPQIFVKRELQEPRCQKNEEMLFRHDGEIKVIKNNLDMKD